MRWNVMIVIGLIVAGVLYGLYQLSYKVQALNKDLRKIQAEIALNEQDIQILKAEWAYQNRPDALQALAAKYLPLVLVAPFQVATLQDLPDRAIGSQVATIAGIPVPRRKPRFGGVQHIASLAVPRGGAVRLAKYRTTGEGSDTDE